MRLRAPRHAVASAGGSGQAARNGARLPRRSSGGESMSEIEIAALRALLTSRPRPTSVAERRARLDALGEAYKPVADIRLEPVSADGVPAEWSIAPGADAGRVL